MSSSWRPRKPLVDLGRRVLSALTVTYGGKRFPSVPVLLAVSALSFAYSAHYIDLPKPVERARVRALTRLYARFDEEDGSDERDD